MRYFHKRKNSYFCPSINLDKLWGLIPEVIPPYPLIVGVPASSLVCGLKLSSKRRERKTCHLWHMGPALARPWCTPDKRVVAACISTLSSLH